MLWERGYNTPLQQISTYIHRQKEPISNPPNKQMLTNQMIPKLISKTTAFIFQRNVSKMDMSSEKDSQSSQKENLVKFGNRFLLKRLHLAMDLQKTASREPRNLTTHLSHLHPLWAGEMEVQGEPMNLVMVGNVEAAI